MSLTTFSERPLAVAIALDAGHCGGTYVEACMIISNLISGIASLLWPGEGIDRKRFIEVWERFCSDDAHRVSIPILLRSLNDRPNDVAALQRCRAQMHGPGYGARVVTGDDIDMSEAETVATCPTLTRAQVRASSYANVLYKHVRNDLVHEYELGEVASAWPMTSRDAGVSYVNYINEGRRIHFRVAWLVEQTRRIARGADDALANGPVAEPHRWWSEG